MDDEFGGSLTPPVSPCEMEGMETDMQCCRPPCFSCTLGQCDAVKLFSPQGYLASGSLNRLLLRLDPSPMGFGADTVDIFGFQWVTEMALVESPHLLFGLLRQQISRLEDLAQTNSCDFGNITSICGEADDIRQQCVNLLQYIKVFIFRYLEPSRELSDKPTHPYEELEIQLPSVLVEELHALALFIGHLRERPSIILSNLSISNQGKVFPPSWHLVHLHLDIQWSMLEILHILSEKMLGQVIYAQQFMNLTGQNLTNVSLFEDHCNNLLRDLIVLAVNKYTKVRPTDALNVCHYQCSCVKELWLLLIHLLDHRNKTSQTESFWNCLNSHLRDLLQEKTSTGVRLCVSNTCKDPCGFTWWLVTHLAVLYTVDKNGTTQDKKLIESNWSLAEELLKLSVNAQNGILEEHLRMHLQCCLKLCDLWCTNLNTVTILWEYYSKFLNSPFNIPWLGLQGLANVIKSPFAMLEMTRTCCSGDQSSNLYESQNSFQFFLRILALQITKGQEASGTHPWKQLKGRSVNKRLVQLTQQVPLPSHSLPAPLVAKERHLAIACALWKNFFPFVKSQRLSQTPSSQTADVAAGFSLLAVDMPSTAPSDLQPQPLISMMQIFGWDNMVHPQLVCRYLSHLIQNSSVVDALRSQGCSSYQTFIIHSWFRCTLQQYLSQPVDKVHANTSGNGSMEQLAGLTRIVFKLPEMENLLNQSQLDQTATKLEPRSALLTFIKAVGKTYSKLQTLGDKSSFASKALEYAGDILKYTKPYLVNKGPSEGLQLLYWAVGCIVKHWALILATSKSQPFLFRIIDRLLLPHTLFQQGTELPPALLSAIRDNLPLYLQGLAAIVGHTTVQVAYVKQQLRSIILKYFDRFLPPSTTGSGVVSHPLLIALRESTPVAQQLLLRKAVVLVISESYMQFRSHAPPPRLAAVLSFLLDLLQRNQNSDTASEAQLLLPTVLKCLMLVNEPQVKKLATDVMECIIENCQLLTPCQACPHLSSVLRQFIQENFGIYDHQVFNILEMVAVLNQGLVVGLIPTLSQTLKDTEHKQGLGRNSLQRASYRRLLIRLGEEGQAEIAKLENSND
ncbi:protein MMS22-like isoform X3 [Hypanus sabinus]|uniref:protein MMS22-like isoform X3 n=1 Tax=Hypanus sabinus TaxID=79690 RepID=UPI0028C3E831|nr:protein MMS22-like isoform X3 [Hypanus sabinus]